MMTFRRLLPLALIYVCALGSAAPVDVVLPLGGARATLDSSGRFTNLRWDAGESLDLPRALPAAILQTDGASEAPMGVEGTSDSLAFTFAGNRRVEFALEPQPDFTLLRLRAVDPALANATLRVRLPVPAAAVREGTLNSVSWKNQTLALMAGSPEVIIPERAGVRHSVDLAGVTHQFLQTTTAMTGRYAARFSADSTTTAAGWALQGSSLPRPRLKLKDVAGVAAWVHGDGKGQHLKFQFLDEQGGARDYYLPINFTGWREVLLTEAALDITKGDELAELLIYYNGIPAETSVTCSIDTIRAIVHRDHKTSESILLEDFENPDAAWWTEDQPMLELEWNFRYTKPGDSMAVVSCDTEKLFPVIQRMEKAAGIIVPHPKGEWNKTAAAVGENYLFLTNFQESQFDNALALARLGGFKRVLLGQESWCKSTGHYEIKPDRYTGGLPGLVKIVERFRAAGIDVGLHLLGASIDNNDPYLTPVPDPRLLKDAQTTLTKGLDAASTRIEVASMPAKMPAEDGGYYGDGTVLQIGDELIKYSRRSTEAPYEFTGCERGYLGTRPAAHAPGAPVYHLARSYGYHMFDMDTTLLDEVTSNFAAVANACDIGMVYFDGSERLQGGHGRYNARLINAYLSKLKNPDILVQASSFSHFSWHQLARSASADGHGDLKGYLEQRAGVFESFARKGMPLDVGWYYGYDKMATPDMYEYILGTTVGYGASFSFQVSVDAAGKHPFTDEILRLVRQYEDLRRSGRVPDALRKLLQVPRALIGRAPEEKNRPLEQRRDYRLVQDQNQQQFQRVIYGEWQELEAPKAGEPFTVAWTTDLTTGPCRMGWQVHLLEEKSNQATTGSAVRLKNPRLTAGDKRMDVAAELQAGQYLFVWPDEAPRVYGPRNQASVALPLPTGQIHLEEGRHELRFEADVPSATAGVPWRVRAIFLAPETHSIGQEPKEL